MTFGNTDYDIMVGEF